MKLLILLSLVLVATAAYDGSDLVPSIEPGVMATTGAYETFLQSTYNASCSSCRCTGCCPVIVRNCYPDYVGSVIEPFTGFRGNVAIIVDWGCTAYTPCHCCGYKKGRRLCTTQDTGFRYYVDWGDGTHETHYQEHLGPFQVTHQYDKTCRSRSYGVTVFYCHDPGCPSERCCDSIFRRIDVREDPGSVGLAGVDYNKPLKAL